MILLSALQVQELIPTAKIAALTCIVNDMIMMLIIVDGVPIGKLKVIVKNAHDLLDTGMVRKWSIHEREIAEDDQWNGVRKNTRIVKGIHNPIFNEYHIIYDGDANTESWPTIQWGYVPSILNTHGYIWFYAL